MALSLGVWVKNIIYIGDTPLEIKKIRSLTEIEVVVDGKQSYVITDLEVTEVLPSVYVSCGVPTKPTYDKGNLPAVPRLVF